MSLDDRAGEAFRRALDGTARAADLRGDKRGAPAVGLWVGAGFDLAAARGGGEARWSLALEWEDESPAPAEPPLQALSSSPPQSLADTAEAVAGELGFTEGLGKEELARRWRAFVWLNHPDRQPAHAGERANARVAVANALYDRARRALRRD